MMADLQDQFRTMGDLSLPNIHALDDDRLRSMWVLHAAKLHLGTLWMTAAEISAVLRDVYGIDVSRQRVQGILGAEKGTVARRKVKGRRLFQLMQKGSDELTAVRSVIFVEPDSALSRLRDVQEILGVSKDPSVSATHTSAAQRSTC